jgi:hypothetical protein
MFVTATITVAELQHLQGKIVVALPPTAKKVLATWSSGRSFCGTARWATRAAT